MALKTILALADLEHATGGAKRGKLALTEADYNNRINAIADRKQQAEDAEAAEKAKFQSIIQMMSGGGMGGGGMGGQGGPGGAPMTA